MTDSQSNPPSSPSPGIGVILLAGGVGQRAGFAVPKQYQRCGSKSVLQWSLDVFRRHPRISHHVVVGDKQSPYPLEAEGWIWAAAGAERQDSVGNGLKAFAEQSNDMIILVHDAARPGVSSQMIDRLIAAVASAPNIAAIPTLPVPDTLIVQADGVAGDGADRDRLARVQTPQAFRLGHLRQAHALFQDATASDDAQMVRRLGIEVRAIAGEARLHKLTVAEDLTILTALLEENRPMRTATAMGYDVHRLVADRPLWIGGIIIPHSHGLDGHSDADVALHALTDAVLGAISDGDIGDHFPPSDEQWRGASSDKFLAFAADRVSQKGGIIEHVDITIITEAPKIGPHRMAMRSRIAEILNLPLERISVKATTNEELGFAGRREGIAAQAVATVKLPC